jgi:hypothetical protein
VGEWSSCGRARSHGLWKDSSGGADDGIVRGVPPARHGLGPENHLRLHAVSGLEKLLDRGGSLICPLLSRGKVFAAARGEFLTDLLAVLFLPRSPQLGSLPEQVGDRRRGGS